MYKKGSVILVPFPFTDLSGNKVRPAIIVSEKKIGSDVVVVFITSQIKLKERHLVIIKPEESNGLKVSSRVICSKIATLDAKTVLGELGKVSNSVLGQIEKELRTVLGL